MRPHVRIPLLAAAAIPAAAYAVRSLVRGTAAPDLPGDAVVLALVVLALVAGRLYGSAAHGRRDDLPEQVHDDRDSGSAQREHDEV